MIDTQEIVAERYRLVEPIGRGGGGEVWRASDLELGIDVALKIVRSHGYGRDALYARFAVEAELSARMLSRHTVRVLDRGVTPSGAPFLVFELLEGADLGAQLDDLHVLSLADTAAVVVQVCRALARVHSLGIVHRDVKPQNIFLCREEGLTLVKLLDFGIARLGSACQSGEVEGTPEYQSPEVLLDGKAPDARADLYALGAVAYRCFTGRVPHPGETLGRVLLSHQGGPPVAPSRLRVAQDDLAGPLDDWFATALHRDLEHRFHSAREMAEAFVSLHRRSRVSDRVHVVRPRRSFPSLSGIDLGEAAPPERVTSTYSIVTEHGRARRAGRGS